MKKNFVKIMLFFAVLAFGSSAFAEKKIESNINLGVTLPVSRFLTSDDISLNEYAVGFDASYLGILQNGFTLKGGLSVQWELGNDFKDYVLADAILYDFNKTNSLTWLSNNLEADGQMQLIQFMFGAGFTPFRNGMIEFSSLVTLGGTLSIGGRFESKSSGSEKLTYNAGIYLFDIGGDFRFAFFPAKNRTKEVKKIGLFAEASLCYVVGSLHLERKHTYYSGYSLTESKSDELTTVVGLLQFKPTLGMCITF